MNAQFGLVLGSFIAGSIPFGLLVARVFQAGDLRAQGSGNIGATNVSRVLGFWPAGALTLLLDALKGTIPVAVALNEAGVFGSTFPRVLDGGAEIGLAWWVGLAAVLGHCFSPWLKFKGGKGVATGLGAAALLSPWAALAGALAFGLVFALTRTGSRSSLVGIFVAAVAHLVIHDVAGYLWAGALLVFVIVLRHGSNLDALLEGSERRF